MSSTDGDRFHHKIQTCHYHTVIFCMPPNNPCWRFVAQVPLSALASYGSPLWVAFHTTPLVSLHIRVKSEDFVYPL